MALLHRILVPIDGSPSAERAITLALRLAREHEAEVLFCYAINYAATVAEITIPYEYADVNGVFEALEAASKDILHAATARADAAGLQSSAYKLDGRADVAIVSYAVERQVDAIVMGTRGQSGIQHLFLGSTAEGVLRAATVPVFVVHADCTIPGIDEKLGFGAVLVAIDDSDPSDAAAAFATELAAHSGSRLIISHVIDTNMLYEQTEKYSGPVKPIHEEWEAEGNRLVNAAMKNAREDAGVTTVEKFVTVGEPVSAILKLAAVSHADLIALGTHGRRGMDRMVMGSVAENVVRRSSLPVLVVRSFAELSHGRRIYHNGTTRAQRVTA